MTTEPALPAAVLWDMDGTLIDSEPYWIQEEIAVVAAGGGTWTQEDGYAMVGNPLTYCAEKLVEAGAAGTPAEVMAVVLSGVIARVRAEIPWEHDAVAALDHYAAAGVPQALVTMSYAAMADIVVASKPVFDAVVTGDAVERGKPDPMPYLVAAERIGVAPEDCLAIEDSPTGVTSALASGARTVAILRAVEVGPRPGLSRVRSLTELTPEVVARIMAGEVHDTA